MLMPRTHVGPPTGPHKEFALRFREACKHSDLPTTLEGLAKVFRVAKTTVHDWRHGEKLPGSETMAIIAEKTKCSFDWLATGRGTDAPPPSRSAIELARRIDGVSEDVQDYIKAILGAAEQRHNLYP